jgi:hypothetical protein
MKLYLLDSDILTYSVPLQVVEFLKSNFILLK